MNPVCHSFGLHYYTHSRIYQDEPGKATVSIGCKFDLPTWMLCFRSGTN